MSRVTAVTVVTAVTAVTAAGMPMAEDGPLTRCSETLAADLVAPFLQKAVHVPRHLTRKQLDGLLKAQSTSWVISPQHSASSDRPRLYERTFYLPRGRC